MHNSQPQNNFKQQHNFRQQQQQQQIAPARAIAAASNNKPIEQPNQLNDVGSDDEENDEDQDSEALLYKMLQQQNFLLSPNWQQEALGSTGSDHSSGESALSDGRQPAAAASATGKNNQLTDSSKRMIKLLKSYSHIHQVDDSDDQIRGTGTRIAPRRPSSSARQASRPPITTDYSASSGKSRQVQHNR